MTDGTPPAGRPEPPELGDCRLDPGAGTLAMDASSTEPDTGSIARGAVRGTLWLASTSYAGFAINILINLAVMRLLGRAEVGAYVLAFAVHEFVALLGGFSLELAVIHFKTDGEETLLDTAYILYLLLGFATVLVSLALYFLLAIFPPFTQEVRLFIVILGLSRPLLFMASIASARMERQFRYRILSLAMLAATILPNLVALSLAWLGGGPVSLVARDVSVALFSYLLYVSVSQWRCRWRWSRASALRLIRYSNPMFLTRILETILMRFDRISVGSGIGKDQLGSYHNGRYLAEMGYTFATPISRLSFNVYSRLKDDPARLERACRLVNYFLIRGAVLAAVVLGFQARDVVMTTYGRNWLPAVPTARLLAPYAAILPILSNLIMVLYGRGMMRQSVKIRAVQVGVFVPGVLLATWLGGHDATGWAVLAVSLIGLAMVLRSLKGIVSLGDGTLYLAPALAGGGAALAALFAGPALVKGDGFFPSLLRLVFVTGVYTAGLVLVDRRSLADHVRYLRSVLAKP